MGKLTKDINKLLKEVRATGLFEDFECEDCGSLNTLEDEDLRIGTEGIKFYCAGCDSENILSWELINKEIKANKK